MIFGGGCQALRLACLQCELPRLLEASMPPDEEMVDLIQRAFLEGQIDGLKADMAYYQLLTAEKPDLPYLRAPTVRKEDH